MAFTTVATAVTGQTYTAANYNTYVRDNFTAVWVYTTAGDLSYSTSGTTKARLPIGTARQVLGVNAGATAPEWIDNSAIIYDEVLYTTPQTLSPGDADWHNMPNAVITLTVANNSKIVVSANMLIETPGSQNNAIDIEVQIDGTQGGLAALVNTSAAFFWTPNASWSKDVSAGSGKNIRLRYKDQFSNDFDVERLHLMIWTVED